MTVNVNPVPSAPLASNSTQCGNGIPTCSVSTAESGVGFIWYSAATGGTLLQTGGSTLSSTSISATTTFYVSAMNTTTNCESPRTAVLAEVVQPDAITASASAATICLGAIVNLSVAQTGSSNTYAYSWNGAAGSGVTITSTGATSSAPIIRASKSAITIICTASNVFTVIGDIA